MIKPTPSRRSEKSRISPLPENLEARVLMSADIGVLFGSLSAPQTPEHIADTDLFSTHFTSDHGVAFDTSGALVFEDGLTIKGDLIVTHASSVTFKGSVQVTGNIIIDSSTSIVVGDGLSVGGSALLLSDEVDFLGGVGSAHISGDLVVRGHSSMFDVEIGASADSAGRLDLTDADLAAVELGGKMTIGTAGATGAVVVDSAIFHSAVDLVGSTITVQGHLYATGAQVTLSASGVVRNDGLIDVSANPAGGAAGELIVTGKQVGNFGQIIALGSSATNGGSVKMISTLQTLVSSNATIDVSGKSGGSIYLWSDANTTMSGQLTARGLGAGDGGFVEVSSAGGFSLTGHVDTTAVSGKTGTLLIDPKNVIIASSGAGTLPGADQFSDTPSTDVTLSAAVLNSAASAVTIQANNDITVNAALNMTQDLKLQAGRSVIINNNIDLANKTLTIIANDAAGIDSERVAGAGSITTLSGVTLNAGSGTINLTVDVGDFGPAGGITIDKVKTTGTLNISTAGFLRETAGDAAPTAGAMTSEDDLTAGILNLTATATDATFGEALGQGNGALEVAAGVINANVQLPGGAPASDFVGYLVLADADHTNGSPGGTTPTTVNAPMTIGTINLGGGSVVLNAKGGSIVGTAGITPNITATQLNLIAEGFNGPGATKYYGGIGSSSASLRTDVNMLTATASDGGVYIDEANDVMINSIVVQDKGVAPQSGANGSVVVQPAGESAVAGTSSAVIKSGGDMVVLDLKIANKLTLDAAGIIVDGNQDSANIMARDLIVKTGGDFGNASDSIETTVMTLQATTTNGGVFANEADGVNATSITAGGTGNNVVLSSGAGAIVFGSITANGGSVTVKSQSDAITDGNGVDANITAASATLEARTGIGASSDALEVNAGSLSTKVLNSGVGTYISNSSTLTALAIETNNGAVAMTLNGGALNFVQPGSANQLSFNSATASTFAFSNTGGSVAINSINVGTGAVTITAKTSITDHANDTVLDVKAGALTLTAGTFIGTGANSLETDVDTLTANANAGGIFINDVGSINSLTANAKGAGNDVTISTGGDMVVAKVTAADVVTLSTGGTGNILRSGNVLNISGASANLHAGGGVGTSTEALILQVGTLTSAVADTGSVFIKAKGAINAATVRAANGDVDFTSEGNLTLGLLEAGSGKSAKVTSTSGAIVDGNAGSVNVRGGSATITAAQIGAVSDALDTEVSTLTATATSGGAYINEVNDITVTRIEAQGLGSDVSLTAGGNIVLGVAKADGDKVNIKSISGSISDGNGAALNITADQLDISAPGGIGALQNSVNKLGSANGGATGVTISNIGALAITDATLEGKGAGLLTIQADSITVLDMADNIATLDPNGSLKLVTTTGNVIFLDSNDTIAAAGNGSITINAGLGQTPTYPNTGAVAAIGNLRTAGGAIDVRANHHITIGMLDTGGTGNVTVVSETGVILDGNGAANNINGNVVTLAGAASNSRVAQLETDIRIADYSAIRSEAAAKLTNAQSLATATAIMKIQKDNALQAKGEATDNLAEAEAEQQDADDAFNIAYITATVLDGVATALSIARDIAAIPAGAAQAIPFSGDGGAMTGYSVLDVSANAADVAAYAANVVADQLGFTAEEKANGSTQAAAELTALDATYQDSLSTWKAFDEATSVAQKAADAAAIARDHALVVRDQAIQAEDQINVIGTSANPLGIQAKELNASSVDGSVYVTATGDVSLGGISATGSQGTVSLQASGNIHVVGTTEAPTQVSLNAGGSIIDGGGLIDAPKFLGAAQGQVGTVANPIHTTIDVVAIKAQGGSAGLSNSTALEIGTIDGVSGITAAGAVGVTSTGSLTFTNVISAAGQSVTLTSQTGSIIDAHTGSPEVTAQSLNVTASKGVKLDTAVTSLTANVTGTGSIEIHEADGLTLTSVQNANGSISVEAGGSIAASNVVSQTDSDANDITLKTTGGNIQLGTVNAGGTAGDVSLEATGSISMLGGGRVTADAIGGTAGMGVSLTSTANSLDLQVSGTGSISVSELDSVLVNHLVTTNGNISLTSGGNITLAEGAVTAASGANNVSLTAAGTLTGPLSGNDSAEVVGAVVTLVTTGANHTIGASTANPLEIDAKTRLDVQTQGSDAFLVDLSGGAVIGLANTGAGNFHLTARSGSITAANQSNSVADIVAGLVDLKVTGETSTIGSSEASQFEIQGSTLTVKTDGGSAYLTDLAGGIALNTLDVGAGDLFLTASGGAITDNDGGAANNIVAKKLSLTSPSGIGTVSDAIEVKVSAFEGSGGAGDVVLTNQANGLTLGGVTNSTDGVGTSNGRISITTAGSLSVNEAIFATNGVALRAADDVTVILGTTVITGGTLEIQGDYGDSDAGTGSQITLDGAIGAFHLEITTQGDDDTLTIRDAEVGSHSINMGTGNDTVVITSGNTLATGTIDLGDGNDSLTTSAVLQNVTGGAGNDSVLVKAGGSISGNVAGGTGYDSIAYDHDGVGSDDFSGPVTVNLEAQTATSIGGFSGIDRFEATSSANDVLIGANIASTWHLTGTNAGDIGGAGTFDFTGFENLTGGTQDDAFQFAAAGKITGNLNGGGHTSGDSIDYHSANFDAGAVVTLDGPNGGTATAIGGRFDNVERIVGDSDHTADNALTGNNATNVWTFTGPNAGHINGQFYYQNFGDISGGNGVNTYAYANNSIPPEPVKGGTGNNVLDLSAWTGDLAWHITGDNSGYVVTPAGTFEFSGMVKLIGGSGSDRFIFTNNKILGAGLGSAGALEGGAGVDFIDFSTYQVRNLWTRTNLDGTISTDRGAWSYASIEQFLGSEATTYTFDVVDLTGTVTKTTMAPQLLPGAGGGVYMTVTNLGNDEVFKQKINVSFYLSLDGTIDVNDILIGANDGRSINLYQGSTKTPFYTATQVPLGTAPGVYHLLTLVDSAGTIAEGDETNNIVQGGTIEVLPVIVDLLPTITKSTLPATVLPGAKGALTTVVKNVGNSPAKGAVDVEFYLSLDGTVDAHDIALGSITNTSLNLAAGASKTFTYNAVVPDGTPAGDYQVLTRIVASSAVAETEATNNIAAAANVVVETPGADLVGGTVRTVLPTIAVPNDVLKFQIPIKNLGNITATGKLDVDFYLSTDQTASLGSDVFLTSLHGISISIAPNGERILSASAAVPASILGGTFYVVADVNSSHTIVESDTLNNSAASDDSMEVVWRFGNFGDRRGVKLVVPDSNGNLVTFSMKGEGAGDVLGGSDFAELSLVGTNAKTSVNITTKGGVTTTLHDITSTNPLGVFNAPKANVTGDFVADGIIYNIRLGDVSNSTMTFGAGAVPQTPLERITMKLGHVENLSITSDMRIAALSALDWQDTDSNRDFIQAPRIWNLTSGGDFEADIFATGVDVFQFSLRSLVAKGEINSSMTLPRGAQSINVSGWSGGTVDALFVDSLLVRGDMIDTHFTITGLNTVTKTAVGSLKVTGTVEDSTIEVKQNVGSVSVGNWGAGNVLAVGVDSGGDGTFFDGNESAIGGALRSFTAKAYATDNGGTPFGIVVDKLASLIQLKGKQPFTSAKLPYTEGDLKLVLL